MSELTYKGAVAELEEIVRKMESDACDIDQLSDYTTRALELLKFCKERLFKTNEEVEKCLAELREALPDNRCVLENMPLENPLRKAPAVLFAEIHTFNARRHRCGVSHKGWCQECRQDVAQASFVRKFQRSHPLRSQFQLHLSCMRPCICS